MALRRFRRQPDHALPEDHGTAMMFLDESGTIAHDQFFAVGCLKLPEPAVLVRKIQKLRDRRRFYNEFHFANLKPNAVSMYEDVVDIVASVPDATFSCFVADRSVADPIQRFGTPWTAYRKLATQLLLGSISFGEVVAVLADNYSAPDHVHFEQEVRVEVNQRLGRCAVISVCRLDSQAADPLQVVDLLTSGVAFEFRQQIGKGSPNSPKGRIAAYLRNAFGVQSFLNGHRDARLNVALYEDNSTAQA